MAHHFKHSHYWNLLPPYPVTPTHKTQAKINPTVQLCAHPGYWALREEGNHSYKYIYDSREKPMIPFFLSIPTQLALSLPSEAFLKFSFSPQTVPYNHHLLPTIISVDNLIPTSLKKVKCWCPKFSLANQTLPHLHHPLFLYSYFSGNCILICSAIQYLHSIPSNLKDNV